MRTKIVILLCICFTVLFNSIMFAFFITHNECNEIGDFYSSEIMEDEELIGSIYHNHGLFKFLYLKNRSEEEFLASYFNFYEFYFGEGIVLEEFELKEYPQSEDFPYLGGSFRLKGVISGPDKIIDKMFQHKHFKPIDDNYNVKFLETWPVNLYDAELDKCAIDLSSVIYSPTDNYDTEWRTQRDMYIFLSKSIYGKKYVYMVTDKVEWTVESPYCGDYE